MASFKQSTGTEFFNKRMRKDGSGSRLQRQTNSKNQMNSCAGPQHAGFQDKQRVRFGGSQQNWMQSNSGNEGQLMRPDLRSR